MYVERLHIKRVFSYLFQSTLGNFTEYDFMAACFDLMSVGDTDFSPPTTAVNLVFGDSSRHLRRWENSHLFS